MNGILVVNKDKGMTSRDVINILNKKFNTKKMGHTGTLDPIATGVLVVAIGNYTKLVNELTSSYKEYEAQMKLGILTDTLDITGNVLDKKDYKVDKKQVINILNSFLGKSIQEVPIYSAIKVNGKKLYEYARNNEEVTLPKREIDIKYIKLLDFDGENIKFKVMVSKGTYIRSLIRDIGIKLNTYGVMTSLKRTKQGIFDIKDSYTLENIDNNNYKLLNYEDIFKDYEIVKLNDDEYFKVKNGSHMNINFQSNEVIYTYKGKYIAMYEKSENYAKIKIMFKEY